MRSKLNIEQKGKEQLRIFISYSHHDKKYREAICKHLKILEEEKSVSIWHDRNILPGDEWEGKIDTALNNCEIILLLVSVDFVNSHYCWDKELRRGLQRHSAGEAVVVPILVRPLHGIEHTPFQHLNYIPEKPLSQYESLDEGCVIVASEIEKVINNFSNIITENRQKNVWWTIKFRETSENILHDWIKDITVRLRDVAKDVSVNCIECINEKKLLVFQSNSNAYNAIEEANINGTLSDFINEKNFELSRPVGARLKISAQQVNNYIDPVVFEKYKEPEILSKELRFPPFIGGVVYSIDNPVSPGFSLFSDQHTKLTNEEVVELQYRLGRYLNTFLAVETKYHYVNLSPTEEYAGLPMPLRTTEAGRDLLVSDLLLKRVTCQLLHPSGSSGALFWREVRLQGLLESPDLTRVLRLWVTPSKATLEEKKVDERTIRADLIGFSLKVECESEYFGKGKTENSVNEKLVSIFKDIILPKVQEQVSAGYSFGLLRQIYSVVIISKWFREKFKTWDIRFIDSNNTKPYSVPGIEEEIKNIHAQYLNLYNNGEWKYMLEGIDAGLISVKKELLIVGGLLLTPFIEKD